MFRLLGDDNANINTDDYSSYNILTNNGFNHETVNHSMGEYARGSVHTNTVEAEFSVFRDWMATYRSVSKENLYLYCSHYEFCRNNRSLNPVDRAILMMSFLRLLILSTLSVRIGVRYSIFWGKIVMGQSYLLLMRGNKTKVVIYTNNRICSN